MIAGVIRELMQALPQRIREFIAGKTLVANDPVQLRLRELRDVVNVVEVHFLQLGADGGEIGKRGRGKKSGRRAPLEPLIPHPLGAVQVRYSVTRGTETRAEIARELFVRERGAGIREAASGPGVVLKHKTQQFRRYHRNPPEVNLIHDFGMLVYLRCAKSV